MFDMLALSLPAIRGGTPIFALIDQPGDCSPGCPCEVGPSDGSHYGMHWTGVAGVDRRANDADSFFVDTEDARGRYQEEEVDA